MSRFRDTPIGKSFKILPTMEMPPVDSNGKRAGSNAEWLEVYEYIDANTSPSSGKTVPVLFELEYKAGSFRSAVIEWGRVQRNCYNNGWRFTTHIQKPTAENDKYIVNVWKVPARPEDYIPKHRGHYKKRQI